MKDLDEISRKIVDRPNNSITPIEALAAQKKWGPIFKAAMKDVTWGIGQKY